MALPKQPEVNIGTMGHVDHGKTTLVEAITGIWTARHSEELKRGITLKIGYADAAFYKCPKCEPPACYSTQPICPHCGSETELRRVVSFVDCPGHEALMATTISGAAVMDGALLVIAADEPVPQPQTREHLAALEIVGIKNIVIVQNKVDLVSKTKAIENYEQIRKFVEGTIAEDAPIIPVSAQHKANVDAVIQAIEERIPTPKRKRELDPLMYVLRSFDVNKPGTPVDKLVGGVIGGSLLQGEFKVGDEIEIRPGLKLKQEYEPIFTVIESLRAGGRSVEKVTCGGLVGIGTKLDPALTKADGLRGQVVGKPGKLPPVWNELTIRPTLFERVLGLREMVRVKDIEKGERLVINVGTSLEVGVVVEKSRETIHVRLSRPLCALPGSKCTLARRIGRSWRLIGYGTIEE